MPPPPGYGRWNPGEVAHRREVVRIDRERRAADIWREQERARMEREDWRRRHVIDVTRIGRDVRIIRDYHRWRPRFDRWERHCPRPTYPVITRPIYYPQPMPSDISVYESIEVVATNMEQLTRTVYDTMAGVIDSNPNREYADRLMRVLAELSYAASNYTDAVYQGEDYEETLNDLFYLEEQVNLATTTLSGYSKEYLVADEMASLRYYVQELLWQYHSKY